MKNFFKDPRFTIPYKQTNLDLGNPHGKLSERSIAHTNIHQGQDILDLGCGTSVSTSTLLDKASPVFVIGAKLAGAFLNMARMKFGLREYATNKAMKRHYFSKSSITETLKYNVTEKS
ncbi:hypothetical protein JW711_05730 [Candidatus Woesearchaeota archaeon]|nr:hypothetical protein [Candidatus Woesearchaeota archaeon]